jgi:LuxR family transcriptional regulator, maltose regulon positive regulatory protein
VLGEPPDDGLHRDGREPRHEKREDDRAAVTDDESEDEEHRDKGDDHEPDLPDVAGIETHGCLGGGGIGFAHAVTVGVDANPDTGCHPCRVTSTSIRRHRLRAPTVGPAVVARPRLTDVIRSTPPGSTCLISAPAGYGATTALAQALSAPDDRVAWVGLDHLDAGDGRLWAQVIAGIETALESPLDWAFPLERIETGYLVSALIESLQERPPLWIVLDGFDARWHGEYLEDVCYLASNLPSNARLAITTHVAPAAFRIGSQQPVNAIGHAQLAPRPEESASILERLAPAMDVEDVDRLVSTADGLTAALVTAGVRATAHPDEDATSWLLGKGARALFDPVLESLPAASRDFLMDTVILDELNADLCDAVLESRDSSTLLDDLDRAGVAVFEVTDHPRRSALPTWRRHPLLTQVLRHHSRATDMSDKHARAADWFEAQGDVEGTMSHLLSAGSREAAGRYLRSREDDLIAAGQAHRVLPWYNEFTEDDWGLHALHLLRLGWGRAMTGDRFGAEVASRKLTDSLISLPEAITGPAILETYNVDSISRLEFIGEAHLLRAHVASLSADTATMLTAAQHAVECFAGQSDRNSHQTAPLHLARALLWCGEVDAAISELDRLDGLPFPTDLLREASLAGLRAQCQIAAGQVTRGRLTAERSLAWMASQGLSPLDAGQYGVMTAYAQSLAESGSLEEAESALEGVATHAAAQARTGDQVHALTALARIQVTHGDLARAHRTVTEARQALLASTPGSTMTIPLVEVDAMIRLASGDVRRAERLITSLPPGNRRTLLWARLSLTRQSATGGRMLETMRPSTPRQTVERHLLLAAFALGRSTRLAEGHLIKAADTCGPNGMLLALAGSSRELIDLADATARREGHDDLGSLVSAVRALTVTPKASSTAGSDPSAPTLPAPLSAGEIELLSLLPGRESNAEIATRLGVSVNTVKTRLQRLYRKLGAEGRDDAIAVARRRGLLH